MIKMLLKFFQIVFVGLATCATTFWVASYIGLIS